MTHAQLRRMQVRADRRRSRTKVRRELDQHVADQQVDAQATAEWTHLVTLEAHYFDVLRPAGLPKPIELDLVAGDDFLAQVEREVNLVGAR
ncbi:MAG TPA: hypothetical protein VLF41_02720 [Candidatus Nanoarchaeia archaeon]|nr:hypothetical protein [Candidatus Nanoarchaeia archaeon]